MTVELIPRLTMPSIVPWWLVALAQRAHQDLLHPQANNYNDLMALLLTVTAGEAAVNRLLEPLVSREVWFGTGKKRGGLDFAPTGARWVRLSKELALVPPLEEAHEPLASFLKTVDARHALVHFKHSHNIHELVAKPVTLSLNAPTLVPVEDFFGSSPDSQLGEADAAIAPEVARSYFPSLEKLLGAVLPAYAAKEDGIAMLFRGALDGKVRI